MSIEAMKQALRVLSACLEHPDADDAIAAIKEALAAPVLEPVAWLVEFENGEQELHFDEQSSGETHTPLYTTPPAAQQEQMVGFNVVLDEGMPLNTMKFIQPSTQGKWVGLTQQEVQEIHDTYHKRMGPQEFAVMLEQRLKEKNNG